jgi:hypothetical protein
MWTDAGADPARCPGSAELGDPAARLPSGYPHGRALCTRCLGFVALDGDGRLEAHETGAGEGLERGEWFNTFGWTAEPH